MFPKESPYILKNVFKKVNYGWRVVSAGKELALHVAGANSISEPQMFPCIITESDSSLLTEPRQSNITPQY